MVITLTPAQFNNLNNVIEASRRAMASAAEGELNLAQDATTDSVEWSPEEVRIILGT